MAFWPLPSLLRGVAKMVGWKLVGWSLALLVVAVALSGCLTGLDDAGADVKDLLGGLVPLSPVCKKVEGAVVDETTGRIQDVCNLPVATGPQPVNEPSIAINPKDPKNLVAGGNDYNLGYTPGDGYPLARTVWAGVYTSKDGGQTWTRGWIPGYPGDPRGPSALTGANAAGDAAIAFAPDGTAYYAGIAFKRVQAGASTNLVGGAAASVVDAPHLFIARSSDGGLTWDQVAVPQNGIGYAVTLGNPVRPVGAAASPAFNDKEYIAVGPDGTVYVTWTAFRFVLTPAGPILDEAPISLIRSSDRGATWTEPLVLSRGPFNQGSVPVVAPDGTLTVLWSEFDDPSEKTLEIVARSSGDGGRSFGPIVSIAPAETVEPRHSTRTHTLPSLAVDASDGAHRGRLAAVWASNESGDADAFLSLSTDRGVTWSKPVQVNDEATDRARAQYFPWAAVGADGAVHVLYLDASQDDQNQRLAAVVSSTLDGVRFHHQVVSDAPFLADRDGFTGDNFLGDYLGMAAGELGLFPIWPDTRTGANAIGDTDLYLARLVPNAAAPS